MPAAPLDTTEASETRTQHTHKHTHTHTPQNRTGSGSLREGGRKEEEEERAPPEQQHQSCQVWPFRGQKTKLAFLKVGWPQHF